jgi:hypothetical protein
MQISRSYSARIYAWPGASMGQAEIGALLSTQQPCFIQSSVHFTVVMNTYKVLSTWSLYINAVFIQ